ncbi:hypothetical protein [Winogradskyella sp.]|jgi:hypothetical protein|uniref:hypothetical protein n=1 Tax=Winogradskyella sp. TaxID=1883156 RepID=UPI00351671FD
MSKSSTTVFNSIGISIFAFLAIVEFSNLLEYIFEQVLFITLPGSLTTLWLPEVLSMVLYVAILLWAIKQIKTSTTLFSNKVLLYAVLIYFGLILIRFLYSMYGTGLLFEKFPEAFDAFHKLRDEHRDLQGIMAFAPTLKYLIAAILIFLNKNALAKNSHPTT